MTAQRRSSFWRRAQGKIIIFTIFVGSLATFLGNTKSVVDFFKNLFSDDKKGMQLVDASYKISDSIFLKNDTIDIKVRNKGSEVAVLKKIKVTIKKKWIFPPYEELDALLISSATYDITIDCNKAAPYILIKDISQEIGPNKSDRFFIKLGKVQKTISESYIYLADLSIIYNESNQTFVQPNFVFGFFDEHGIYAGKSSLKDTNYKSDLEREMHETEKANYLNNIKQIREIDCIKGTKSSEVLAFINKFTSE